MMTYEAFAKRMDELEWLDFCADMADSYVLTCEEKRRHAKEREALVALAGVDWLRRWEQEHAGE